MSIERARILCVDDEPVNLELYGAMLEPDGYETVMAESGREALEKAREGVDLVLLDIMMPGMDGFEVCSRLKADPVTRQVPVVMVTAIADREARMKGLEAGANDFLAKPFDRIELLVRMANLLKVKEFADFLKSHNERLEAEVARKTSELVLAHESAVRIITEGDGRTMPHHFAPRLLEIFMEEHRKLDEIFEGNRDQ